MQSRLAIGSVKGRGARAEEAERQWAAPGAEIGIAATGVRSKLGSFCIVGCGGGGALAPDWECCEFAFRLFQKGGLRSGMVWGPSPRPG